MAHRQRGFVLILGLLLVVVAGASVFLAAHRDANLRKVERTEEQARTLAGARAGLLAYALAGGANNRPGALPCPDFDGDGTADINCQAGGEPVYLERIPWETLDAGRQVSGLWYALDRDVRDNSAVEPLNPDVDASLSIDGRPGFVAVVIDPGDPLEGQDRSTGDAGAFLEAGNEDGDSAFVDCAGDPACNDRVRGITVDDLFAGVQRRVVAGIEKMLRDFYAAHGHVPHPAQFGTEECDGGMSPPLVGQLPFADSTPTDCDGVLDKSDDPSNGNWIRDNAWFNYVVYRVEPDCVGAGAACASATLQLGSEDALQVVVGAVGRPLDGPQHDANYTQDRTGSAGIHDFLDHEENVDGDSVFTHAPVTEILNDALRGSMIDD